MSKKLIAGAGVVASFAIALAPLATFATGSYYPNKHTDTLNVTIEEVCSFGHTYEDSTEIKPGSHTDGTGSGTVEDVPSQDIDAGKGYGKWLDSNGDPVTVATAYDEQNAYKRPNDAAQNNWPSATATATAVADTAYGVMETNTYNANFAKTTLAIICNNATGYQIKAEPDANLVKTAATDPIPFDGDYAMSAATSSAYNFFATDTTTTADTTIMSANSGVSAAGAGGAIEVAKSSFATDIANTGIIASQGGATSTTGDRLTITYGVSIDANQEAGTYEGSIVYTLIQL